MANIYQHMGILKRKRQTSNNKIILLSYSSTNVTFIIKIRSSMQKLDSENNITLKDAQKIAYVLSASLNKKMSFLPSITSSQDWRRNRKPAHGKD